MALRQMAALGALSALCMAAAPTAATPTVDKKLMKVTHHCAVKGATSHVWVVKQRHAPPGLDTKSSAAAGSAYRANQSAVYRQLESWVGRGQVPVVVAEGCQGSLDDREDIKFNGWSLADLKARSRRKDYADLVSSVPLKLEARFGAKVKTVCGDDESLLKETNRAFSDARGTVGFLTRIQQYRDDPERLHTYLDGVRELYKLPASAGADEAVAKLKADLKGAVDRIEALGRKRDEKPVEVVAGLGAAQIAMVYGGSHAKGIADALKAKGIDCTVLEPVGYVPDGESGEEGLMLRLKEALKAL